MNISNLTIDYFQNLVKEGRNKTALDQLWTLIHLFITNNNKRADDEAINKLKDEIILLSGRLRDLKKTENLNTHKEEYIIQERQKINKSLLELIHDVYENEYLKKFLLNENTQKLYFEYEQREEKEKRRKEIMKYLPYWGPVITLLLILLGYFLWSVTPQFKDKKIVLNIIHGSEKTKWLLDEVKRFQEIRQDVIINLTSMGSIESIPEIIKNSSKYHVWLPANPYQPGQLLDITVNEKPSKIGLSPLAIAIWKNTQQELDEKYGKDTDIIEQLMSEMQHNPAFRISFANPKKSNSGIVTLLSFTNAFYPELSTLDERSLFDSKYVSFLNVLKRHSDNNANSTSDVMGELVTKGAGIDAFFIYENIFINNIDLRNSRANEKGGLVVCYTKYSVWNEYPFYVLEEDKHSPEESKAIDEFFKFIFNNESQENAIYHGIRPANPDIASALLQSTKFNEHFKQYEYLGIKAFLPEVRYRYPKSIVINIITDNWERAN